MKNRFIKAVFLFIFSLTVKAQLFYNNGASVFSSPNALIKVHGSFTNANNGTFEHNGVIIIDSTYYNKNTGVSKGNGVYDVYEHWINSGLFIRDTSTVNLKGGLQHIKGDSVTKYYNLNLLGVGEKQLYVNSKVFNRLNLSVNELATIQDTMFLENPLPSSLQGSFVFGSEAFVSNSDSGCFSRKTNQVAAYYYPMGNKSGAEKYRPVQITPNLTSNNYFNISYFNQDPSTKGLNVNLRDTTLCKVNNKYYHNLSRFGNSPADIEIGFLINQDDNYSTIANWKTAITEWNNINQVTSTNLGLYNSNKRTNWSNFNEINYALGKTKPIISGLNWDSIVCINSVSTLSLSPGNYTYDWDIIGGEIIGDSTNNTITIKWNSSGSFSYSVTIIDSSTGCKSDLIQNSVYVSSGPTADFNFPINNLNLPNIPIAITDNSQNATNWTYQVSNGESFSTQNPIVNFSTPGNYTITQTVSDSFGCLDTITKTIKVENEVIIPNVFTPNGDGTNDGFTFNCAGCDDYSLEITNRWGAKVYQGEKGSTFWDGRNPVGEKLSDGTYFYILKVKHSKNEKTYTGFIQLIQ